MSKKVAMPFSQKTNSIYLRIIRKESCRFEHKRPVPISTKLTQKETANRALKFCHIMSLSPSQIQNNFPIQNTKENQSLWNLTRDMTKREKWGRPRRSVQFETPSNAAFLIQRFCLKFRTNKPWSNLVPKNWGN